VNRWYANEYCSNRYVYKCHKIRTKFLNIFFRRTDIQEIRGGWSWFTWTPSIVDFVFNYLEKNPSYLKRFKYTNCGDELIFQTILFPEAQRLNLEMYRPYRYVSWKPKGRKTDVGNNFPYILNEEDFEDVYNSEAFFCRKVDLPVSSELLDLIDMKRECPFDINKALPISNSE
ncbi:MAG: beta-1,6-N-acetylglucosaminyltransferase, partial [Agathobacter sp.]|nr:beta-1,6-N-acetylglucosaminyltransferase [Agathobacter sp.]